jgi:hypothetical protein
MLKLRGKLKEIYTTIGGVGAWLLRWRIKTSRR